MDSAREEKVMRAGRGEGTRGRDDRVFWNDLYWFAVICLGAWILGMLLLPPRAAETLSLLRRESRVLAEVAQIERREAELREAIEAIENDPFYREAYLRDVLKVKKKSEEYLQPPPAAFPITPVTGR